MELAKKKTKDQVLQKMFVIDMNFFAVNAVE